MKSRKKQDIIKAIILKKEKQNMKKPFGLLPDGRQVSLYTIRCGTLEAAVTDFGATLVSL